MKQCTISIFLLLTIAGSSIVPSGCKQEAQKRLNILLILADDLGYSDIGCYGGDIATPNLDQLAENGIRFTQFYNTARCCPSRASILTGLHPHQAGLGAMVDHPTDKEGYLGELNNHCVTLSQVLHEAGYSTYMSGKWHVAYHGKGSDQHNWPLQRGFDKYFGTIPGAGSYFAPHLLIRDNDTIEELPSHFYYTDAIADTAIKFLDGHFSSNRTNPFFMYVAFTAPHWPLHAKTNDIDKYRGRFDEGWDVLRERKVERMISMGLADPDWNMFGRDQRVPPWDSVKDKDWQLKRMEVYAAMVDCLDQGIGRIVNYLKDTDELDNTLIIFLSDNGACAESWSLSNPWANRFGPEITADGRPVDYSNNGTNDPGPASTYYSYGIGWAHYSNTPFKDYKSGTCEGGIASPCIVSWPARISDTGGFRKKMTGIIDIMPTLAELAGANYPSEYNGGTIYPFEGVSLVNVILNDETPDRSEYYVEHIGRCGLIDSTGLKIVRYGKGPWQLYNLRNDRTEQRNLSEQMSEITDSLSKDWEAWAWRAKVYPKPE